MKALEDERYVVISVPLLRFGCISIYCMSVTSLHIESTDSMIPEIVVHARAVDISRTLRELLILMEYLQEHRRPTVHW